MKIYIPSKSRYNYFNEATTTIKELNKGRTQDKYSVTLVVPGNEYEQYAKMLLQLNYIGFKLFGLKDNIQGISNVRQFIIENSSDNKVLMLDDDLKFSLRPKLDDPQLLTEAITGEQILKAIEWCDKTLDDYAHCSISDRQQNWHMTKYMIKENSWTIESQRPMRVYGFRKDIVLGEQLNFNAGLSINVMDDFHITLCLMELGYPNIITAYCAQGQKSSDARGGASTYRNLELQKECALNLKKLHPETVKVVEKTTHSAWGGTKENPITRTDVYIFWQKALGIKSKESKLTN